MEYEFLKDPIDYAEQGRNPTVLTKMKSGYAVIGLTQFLPGYCLLMRSPEVKELTDLSSKDRTDFLLDMSLLGEAIQEVCQPLRINYSIYGNQATFLHAHIFPRYEWEPEYHRRNPVWTYPESNWTDVDYQWDPMRHKDLMQKLTSAIENERDKR